MKSAEEYFKELRFNTNHHLGLGDVRLTIAQQEELVKQIQLDAIEETVKLCVKNTKVKYKFIDKDYISDYNRGIVDKDSILNCAEILKRELE